MKKKLVLLASIIILPAFLQSQINIHTEIDKASEQNIPLKSPIDDPSITTFKTSIISAGLEDVFIGTGPFTVFAPTNDAFDKLGKEKMQTLLKPENRDELSILLEYHIVPGKFLSSNLKTKSYKTVDGRDLNVKVENGQITVNGAKVIKADMVGPNGVIYEIDKVLIPPNP